jgi:hypothetical protein
MFLPSPEHIFSSFWRNFHVLAVSPLTVTLQMMSNNCRSFSSISVVLVQFILHLVCYSSDEELEHDVTCVMIFAIFQTFFDHNSTSHLLGLSASEQWSPVVMCGCNYHLQSDLRLLLIIHRVTVKWETAKAYFFRIKTWKWHQKGTKICSGNPKLFLSITWSTLQLFSNSWYYPLRQTKDHSDNN